MVHMEGTEREWGSFRIPYLLCLWFNYVLHDTGNSKKALAVTARASWALINTSSGDWLAEKDLLL
jgi:hypothetical protein